MNFHEFIYPFEIAHLKVFGLKYSFMDLVNEIHSVL
jgi:hypothetical protein